MFLTCLPSLHHYKGKLPHFLFIFHSCANTSWCLCASPGTFSNSGNTTPKKPVFCGLLSSGLWQLFSAFSEFNTNINPTMQKNAVLGLHIEDYWVSVPCEKPLANPWTSEDVVTSQRPSCKICVNKYVMQPLSYKVDIQLYTCYKKMPPSESLQDAAAWTAETTWTKQKHKLH